MHCKVKRLFIEPRRVISPILNTPKLLINTCQLNFEMIALSGVIFFVNQLTVQVVYEAI
ncbi:MAG TPA: hypothetical protein VLF59_01365 [Candidatus Saccharimonadales bacterium]|nr:hypothetical protein [Candidatus Saccharimonadales bacterium]